MNHSILEQAEHDHWRALKESAGVNVIYRRGDGGMEMIAVPAKRDVDRIKFENVTTAHIADISFDIASGEVVGFAGLEGSNKHFISECMLGIDRVLSGKISLKGEPVNFKHVIDAVRNQVGYMPNDRKNQGILLCRNIIENITITSVIKAKAFFTSSAQMRKAAEKQTASMNIVCANNRQLVQYLSGGNQQKVLLGRWFQAETDVLMLNEPTEGIDVGARADIYRILHEAADLARVVYHAVHQLAGFPRPQIGQGQFAQLYKQSAAQIDADLGA